MVLEQISCQRTRYVISDRCYVVSALQGRYDFLNRTCMAQNVTIKMVLLHFRHQKKGDFQQQEADVKNNMYDREHFSDAAVFENKAFVEGEIYKDRL